jgi:hypothetical protein
MVNSMGAAATRCCRGGTAQPPLPPPALAAVP